jgi:hypothetical protein
MKFTNASINNSPPQFKFEVLVTNNGLLIVFWDKDLSLLYKWLLLKQLNTLINEEDNPTQVHMHLPNVNYFLVRSVIIK